jgi:NAD(P)-dependent dehydrogenase (short-subunit alcohol dehydrogenase family)
MDRLKHKTAIVTGGASGIGRRTVERLLAEGWNVWALDLSEDALSRFEAEHAAQGRLRCRTCDVSQPASVDAAFATIRREVRKIDALICSAGAHRVGALETHTPDDIDTLLGVNVKGPWLMVLGALPLLRESATVDDPARVVMVGSCSGLRPKAGSGFYGATKAALHVLTAVFAVELAASGVIVNAVAPGVVATPMVEKASKAAAGVLRTPSAMPPLGRIAQPDDIADVILFFLGDGAKYVNGTVLPVDGGERAAHYRELPNPTRSTDPLTH